MGAMAEADWREQLDGWLEPFLAALGHEKRRRWAPVGAGGRRWAPVGAGLPAGADRTGRAQELATDGGPPRPEGPRPAAPLRREHGLGRRAPAPALGRAGG